MVLIRERKIGVAPIIIDRLNHCMYTFDMASISRVVAAGFLHHITQRRNHLERLFEDKSDFRQYLGWPSDYAPRNFLKILAYCPISKNQ